ncbi:hypothetical protein GUJ93_ZPchr0006g42201 [Zizania palustris]|uniref:Uncharacterized protein n=1 Tax=Zizania palustris TaxID=103762 RepID=A0A8J5SRP4_ZIZPA|nr:hypothetical protein GUJ93_ZPchr0006g42201 [Zizania palustris]
MRRTGCSLTERWLAADQVAAAALPTALVLGAAMQRAVEDSYMALWELVELRVTSKSCPHRGLLASLPPPSCIGAGRLQAALPHLGE